MKGHIETMWKCYQRYIDSRRVLSLELLKRLEKQLTDKEYDAISFDVEFASSTLYDGDRSDDTPAVFIAIGGEVDELMYEHRLKEIDTIDVYMSYWGDNSKLYDKIAKILRKELQYETIK